MVTRKVNCQDCFRCVRSCPVKAIGIDKGHARVIEERCILCGRCVLECPQQAKEIDWQMHEVIQAINTGRQVIMSLAPSYVAAFPEYSWESLVDCLTGAGIATVLETAEAADIVSQVYGNYCLS
nr:4Fe-4S dicluster domain-containing protein [Sporomusa acidovorans]